MQVIEAVDAMRKAMASARHGGQSIGLVPTMGALHAGHAGLIRMARDRCDVVVVSVFVNPLQFGPNENFDQYPRDREGDNALCESENVDIAFFPQLGELLPADFSTSVEEQRLSAGLCGISRPQHFRGYATMALKMLLIVGPDVAFYGHKDAQRAAVVQKLVKDLGFTVEINVGPTIRDKDGLAVNALNSRFTRSQRQDARAVYKSLKMAQSVVENGVSNVDRVLAEVTHMISRHRRLRVIYVAIVDKDTMEPLREITPGRALIAVAVWVDEIRLTDNILV